MRILYVSQYFPPEMGAPPARVSELSAHWAHDGHDVTVLTGFPNHPTGKVPSEYRRKMRRLVVRERYGDVRVVRTWLAPLPNRKPLERIMNYASFWLSASITGMFLRRPDVVIGTSPQLLVGLAAWWIARVKRVPFVLEIRDIWPESITQSGVGREGDLLSRTLAAISRFLYARADAVVVVTGAFRDYLSKHYGVPKDKMTVVENGVEAERFDPDGPSARDEVAPSDRFVVSFIGTVGLAHGIATVLDAAELVAESMPDVLFLVIGEGADRARLQAEAAGRGLANVVFLGQQPRERIPALIRATDAGLVLLKKTEIFKTVIPTKMLEFMAGARPVILGVDGQARAILEEAKAGIFVEPEDPKAVADAIRLLRDDPPHREALGKSGRAHALSALSRAATAGAYSGLLRRVADR